MWHLLAATEHHGPGTAKGCLLQTPAMKSGAEEFLAAAGLEPITIVDALLQRLRSSPGAACAVVLLWCLAQGQEWNSPA